jgi:DNA-binding LacI/PurR family transcriptional regulator
VVPYLSDPFFAEIAQAVSSSRCIAMPATGRSLLQCPWRRRKLENDIFDSLRSLKPAGVLLAPLGRASDRSDN